MAGLGDLIVVVEDLATYQAAVNAGKTAPSVMYLILAERQVYFNGELWSKAPEEGGGGVSQEDFDTLYNGVVEAEEVTAAALNDLNDRLGKLAENVQGETVTKEEFETAVSDLNESLSGKADAQTTSEALTALSGQVETLSGQVETMVTSEQLSAAVDNVNNTILENEEVTAAALNDLNVRLNAVVAELMELTDKLTGLNNAGL